MPSDLPKVTAYIQPETAATLDAASKALGQSRSKLVAELLDAAVPVLKAVTDAALVVANVGDMQREALAKLADEVVPMKEQADDLLARFVEAAQKAEAADPRPSNTGVRISGDPEKSAKSRGKSSPRGTGGKTGGKG